MSEQYTYARYWRCALQVNPVGYNSAYRGDEHGLSEADYNQQLLEKCLEHDIKVVGLADHGSVDSIDALRMFLEPHGIVVFPGFEIASTEKNPHGLFVPGRDEQRSVEPLSGKARLDQS